MKDSKVEKICNINQLHEFVKEFTGEFSARQILLLQGELGAGKTQTVKFIVNEFFNSSNIDSPTFAIHNVYSGISDHYEQIDHLDLYRLETEEELESTGFWDLLEKEAGLILIEWPERLGALKFPPFWMVHRLKIEIIDENYRNFQYEKCY